MYISYELGKKGPEKPRITMRLTWKNAFYIGFYYLFRYLLWVVCMTCFWSFKLIYLMFKWFFVGAWKLLRYGYRKIRTLIRKKVRR